MHVQIPNHAEMRGAMPPLSRQQRRALERKEAGDMTMAEVKKGFDAINVAFTEYKKTNDAMLAELKSKGVADPVNVDKLARLEAELVKLEPLNQKLVAAAAAQQQAEANLKEAKERLEKLELRIGRPGTGGATADEKKELTKARVNVWVRGVGRRFLEMQLDEPHRKEFEEIEKEYKSLGITNDASGGYLAPVEFVREIIKSVTETSPVRQLVRVRTTGMKSIEIPKRTGTFAARRVLDQGTRTETAGLAWGMVEIPAPEMYALVDISGQNLEDSAYDIAAEVQMEATDQFQVREGQEFATGTGNGEMEGILVNPDIAFTVSGTAATIADSTGQANGLLALKYDIKTAYSRGAKWAMNRTSLGQVRRLKDGQNNYIWQPGGLGLGAPSTIDGDPYVEAPDMPSAAANAFPIAYGDFFRGYTLVDRLAMQVLRDPYTQATIGNTRFIFRRRVGGRVVLAEAMRKLKCSV